ncbi:MAG: hypothetical protein M1812_003628 [Candelaria pacifica]|nr:MAG: hypothetical protein M1812_003628 [Candelaria pacifica]
MTHTKSPTKTSQTLTLSPNQPPKPELSSRKEPSKEDSDTQTTPSPTTQKASFNGFLENYAFTSKPKPSPTKSPATKTTTTITTTTTTRTSLPKTPMSPSRLPSKRKATQTSTPPSPSSTTNPSPHPLKKRRSPSKYAPPSKYAHLPPLLDILTPNLHLIFIGVNPGLRTSTAGHAYAHPSNLFWKLLHSSGITERRLSPCEDGILPEKYGCGNTNIVSRPTRDQSELSKQEMDASVRGLEDKISRFRPEAVCIVGKGIWESVWRARYGRGIGKEEFRFGWQDEGENMGRGWGDGDEGDWKGAKVFVATSTSGLAASLRPHEKEAIWKPLGEWINKRRRERAEEVKEESKA